MFFNTNWQVSAVYAQCTSIVSRCSLLTRQEMVNDGDQNASIKASTCLLVAASILVITVSNWLGLYTEW